MKYFIHSLSDLDMVWSGAAFLLPRSACPHRAVVRVMGQELAALGMGRMVALTESHRRSPIPSHGGGRARAPRRKFSQEALFPFSGMIGRSGGGRGAPRENSHARLKQTPVPKARDGEGGEGGGGDRR